MKIYGSNTERVRPEPPRESPKVAPTQPLTPAQRHDQVQISDAGRALAAQAAEEANPSLTPERIEQVRARILAGAYDALEVADEVARKLLASGDL